MRCYFVITSLVIYVERAVASLEHGPVWWLVVDCWFDEPVAVVVAHQVDFYNAIAVYVIVLPWH